MANNENKISKFLSYVLRHRPDEIGLTLDTNGWALVSDLIARSSSASMDLTIETIQEIVRSSDKQRFALSDDGTKIRANQGHSISVDLALDPKQPPEFLYHGTATRFLDAIRLEGLKAMKRQHVHLSPDEATATKVGQRHGKPVVIRVRSGEMWRTGRLFYLSENKVWLTEHVEVSSLDIPSS
jgi:putative RNA 2'-phosphotransferase